MYSGGGKERGEVSEEGREEGEGGGGGKSSGAEGIKRHCHSESDTPHYTQQMVHL